MSVDKILMHKLTGYMCYVDWLHEREVPGIALEVYTTVDDLKKARGCVEECGIVEVSMIQIQLVQNPEYFGRKRGQNTDK